jgi:hypothetical protein
LIRLFVSFFAATVKKGAAAVVAAKTAMSDEQ